MKSGALIKSIDQARSVRQTLEGLDQDIARQQQAVCALGWNVRRETFVSKAIYRDFLRMLNQSGKRYDFGRVIIVVSNKFAVDGDRIVVWATAKPEELFTYLTQVKMLFERQWAP